MDGNEPRATLIPPDLQPALSPGVHLSLTIVYTAIYGLLFLLVYVQLWLVLYYRHKRLSHQTVFLYLCLIWAGLRTTLFSFYFRNALLANTLNTFLYWLLYCCPVCLQFTTLGLLVHYFGQVAFKAQGKYEPQKYKCPLRVAVVLGLLLFFGTNISCAVIIKHHEDNSSSPPVAVSMVRVVINDSLFIIFGITLSTFIYSLSKTSRSSASRLLAGKGMSVCQAVTACIAITLLYTSRAVYNMIAIAKPLNSMLSFGYGWINVSDQADYLDQDLSEGFAYVSFGVVLFVWEFLPTFIVLMLFWVHKPRNLDVQPIPGVGNHHSPKAFFFDNPRRYDSDDDLSGLNRSLPSRSSMFEGQSPYAINATGGSYTSDLHRSPQIFTTSSSINHHLPPPPQFYDGT